jgi:outer membrane immunogenic protein
MRIALFAAALAASTALAAPAFAQDSGDESSFTGPRAEGIVGWDRAESGENLQGDARDGVVYGGAVGYDVQMGHAVLGAEAELTGSTTKDSANNVVASNDTLDVKAGRDIYLGGRIGFAVGDRALLYAKGGYTNARINTRYHAPGATAIEDGENLDGWRLGAGAEVKLGGQVYAKAEYRYSNYGNADGYDINLDRHQVVGGVGIRF